VRPGLAPVHAEYVCVLTENAREGACVRTRERDGRYVAAGGLVYLATPELRANTVWTRHELVSVSFVFFSSFTALITHKLLAILPRA